MGGLLNETLLSYHGTIELKRPLNALQNGGNDSKTLKDSLLKLLQTKLLRI
jgi:hypothetical protein